MSDDAWVRAGALDDLPDGTGAKVTVGEASVLLVRSGDRVFAIGSRCTHQGAPLDRGLVKISGSLVTVTCPTHGSIFGLDDGKVVRGPAMKPVEAYETRVLDGSVEIRRTG
jgi:nitrite reductase/ring-hydroxylating ferredoxin subunit